MLWGLQAKDVATLGIASLSFGYSVWVDRFKYRGRPNIYVDDSPADDSWEITLQNNNSYAIQLQRISARSRRSVRRGMPRSRDISELVHGRSEFPILLESNAKAVISFEKGAVPKCSLFHVTVSSGRVGVSGRPRIAQIRLRLPEPTIPNTERKGIERR